MPKGRPPAPSAEEIARQAEEALESFRRSGARWIAVELDTLSDLLEAALDRWRRETPGQRLPERILLTLCHYQLRTSGLEPYRLLAASVNWPPSSLYRWLNDRGLMYRSSVETAEANLKQTEAKPEQNTANPAKNPGLARQIEANLKQTEAKDESVYISEENKEVEKRKRGRGRPRKPASSKPKKKTKAEISADRLAAAIEELELPEMFRESEVFRRKWEAWIAVRAKHEELVDWRVYLEENLEKLQEFGLAGAIESISQSLRRNWRGLFAPKDIQQTSGNNGTDPAQRRRVVSARAEERTPFRESREFSSRPLDPERYEQLRRELDAGEEDARESG